MTMKINNLLGNYSAKEPCVLGIGFFDGVHVGHQMLISEILKYGKTHSLPSVIFTFDHSPRKFLAPDVFRGYITTPEEKFSYILSLGISNIVFRPFDQEFSKLGHLEFIEDIIINKLQAQTVFVGFNFHFGSEKNGDANFLKSELKKHGRECKIVDKVLIDDEIVSSSIIRSAIEAGDFDRANLFLGREASFSGEVVHGDSRGHLLGFPTANLALKRTEKILPPNGVYACYTDTNIGTYPSIVNIGYRPTFDRDTHLLEAHLIGFSGDLYHQTIRIRFVKRLRDEKRFDSAESLIEQINTDKAFARCIL